MPLRYNQGVPPLSSRYLPPGSDYADQFSDSSVLRHGDTPSKKERWQSQAGSYRRPSTEGAVATASVNWAGAFATAVKHQPENVPHHSCNFYRDRFHILGEQDKAMSKYGHDILSGYEHPPILRQTKLTPHLREDNGDVGTFARRRGKQLREYPLCMTSTRIAEPFQKAGQELTAGGELISETLARRPFSRERRDLTLERPPTTCGSPTAKYATTGRTVRTSTFEGRPGTASTGTWGSPRTQPRASPHSRDQFSLCLDGDRFPASPSGRDTRATPART
eukprot:jgi/Tetstr1/426724/TSEL_001661.t1